MTNFDIKPDEKVCYNCKHRLWLVAIGLGVRCDYTKKKTLIKSLKHTCENFEFKNNNKEK